MGWTDRRSNPTTSTLGANELGEKAMFKYAAILGFTSAVIAVSSASASTYNVNDSYQWYQINHGNVIADQELCSPTSMTLSGSCGLAGLTVNAQSLAQSDGVLKAATSLNAAGVEVALHSPPAGVTGAGVRTAATAGISDQVSFGGTTPVTLRFTYHIDGYGVTSAVSDVDYLHPDIFIFFGTSQSGPSSIISSTIYSYNFGSNGSKSTSIDTGGYVDVPISGSTPLDFSAQLYSDVLIGGSADDVSPTFVNGYAASDFYNTAGFGVEALDANGRDITAAADLIFSAGELPAYATVPEPTEWLLMIFGLIGSGIALRTQRHNFASRPS